MSSAKATRATTPKSVIEQARKQGAKMVDVKFVDTFGTWQHFTVPMGELTEEVFAEGFGGPVTVLPTSNDPTEIQSKVSAAIQSDPGD